MRWLLVPRASILVFAIGLGCGSGDGGGAASGAGGSSGTGTSSSTASSSGPTSTGAGAGVGVSCGEPALTEGEATYYDFADGSGNCSFPPTPDDLMVAAMNDTDYAGSAACGACVRVDGPNGSVDVRIVDRCPECPAGDIDLSPEAFEKIAPLSAGRVPITWRYGECPIDSPVVFHFKEGSNPWWTAVQLRNHRHAIAALAYRDDEGQWVEVPRLAYNYFVEAAGMGPGPYALRVRDTLGSELVEEGVAFVEGGEVPGTAQFPPCE